MSFKKNKYSVIKGAISEDLAKFCYDYFMMKRQVARTMFDTKYISQFTEYFGVWNDQQVPETYSHYSDSIVTGKLYLSNFFQSWKKKQD